MRLSVTVQAWLVDHRLPDEGPPSAKHETLQPPPTYGYARYLYSNGDCYEGQFSGSLRHGDGVYYSADGMKYVDSGLRYATGELLVFSCLSLYITSAYALAARALPVCCASDTTAHGSATSGTATGCWRMSPWDTYMWGSGSTTRKAARVTSILGESDTGGSSWTTNTTER